MRFSDSLLRIPAFNAIIRMHGFKTGSQSNPIQLLKQGFGFGDGPSPDLAAIRRSEVCFAPDHGVVPRRHFFFYDFLCDVFQFTILHFNVVGIPFRKVQVMAPVVNLAYNQPGSRRYTGIPWPDRHVGMAVVTGLLQDGLYIRLG